MCLARSVIVRWGGERGDVEPWGFVACDGASVLALAQPALSAPTQKSVTDNVCHLASEHHQVSN